MANIVFHSQSLLVFKDRKPVWGMHNDDCLYSYDGEHGNQTLSIYQHCAPTTCVDIKYDNELAHRIPFRTRENAFKAIKVLNDALRTNRFQVDLRELQEDSTVNIDTLIERSNNNDAEAMYFLAMRYLKGEEVKKNANEAAQMFARSAHLGYVESQYVYGSLLQQGLGVDMNVSEAIKWYNLAIRQGEPHAMLNLSSIYLSNKGTKQKGIMLLRKAEYLGLAEAQVNLGVCILKGAHGLRKNEMEAYQYFKSAARQLFPNGLDWFGWMHLGILPKYYDVKKAKYIWFLGTHVYDDFITKLQNSLGSMKFLPGIDDARVVIYDLLHENKLKFGEVNLESVKWLC